MTDRQTDSVTDMTIPREASASKNKLTLRFVFFIKGAGWVGPDPYRKIPLSIIFFLKPSRGGVTIFLQKNWENSLMGEGAG